MAAMSYKPTEAEMLASIVAGKGSAGYTGTAVQRSHRFPYHQFVQIENMANVAGVPVSIIINQLIECGLEAVKKQLADDIVNKLTHAPQKQSRRPTKPSKLEMKEKPVSARKADKAQ